MQWRDCEQRCSSASLGDLGDGAKLGGPLQVVECGWVVLGPDEVRTQAIGAPFQLQVDGSLTWLVDFQDHPKPGRKCRSLLLLRSIEWSLQCSAEELEKDLQQTSMSDWAVAGQQQKLQVAELALIEKQAEVPSHGDGGGGGGDRLLSQLRRAWERTKSGLEFYTSGLQLLWQDPGGEPGREPGASTWPWRGLELPGDVQYASRLAMSLAVVKIGGVHMEHGLVDGLTSPKGYETSPETTGFFARVSKAAFSNYTLRAWEVRTLQRTVKDLLTLPLGSWRIPFLIILIIPLSPVGHVLVFSFFQKNFPEFFPSSFTEQRQNVTKIYRDIVPDENEDARRK
eukprot:Skav212772  [mRNA]  locus=scaffold159:93830:99582:- [translate_table: standard]